jgi:hypothetical protein
MYTPTSYCAGGQRMVEGKVLCINGYLYHSIVFIPTSPALAIQLFAERMRKRGRATFVKVTQNIRLCYFAFPLTMSFYITFLS